MKRYRVRLEYHIIDTIDVEANNEKEAEGEAIQQIDINSVNAELYDVTIKEITP